MNKEIKVYCTICQTETPHTGTVDLNGELVFSCTVCNVGFLKLPAGLTIDEIKAAFASHESENSGNVIIEKSYEVLDEVMNDPGLQEPQ